MLSKFLYLSDHIKRFIRSISLFGLTWIKGVKEPIQ